MLFSVVSLTIVLYSPQLLSFFWWIFNYFKIIGLPSFSSHIVKLILLKLVYAEIIIRLMWSTMKWYVFMFNFWLNTLLLISISLPLTHDHKYLYILYKFKTLKESWAKNLGDNQGDTEGIKLVLSSLSIQGLVYVN